MTILTVKIFTRSRDVSVLVGVAMVCAKTLGSSGGVPLCSHVAFYVTVRSESCYLQVLSSLQ